MVLSQFISIFCCSVSVGNISLHFQTFILLLIIIQWDFVCPRSLTTVRFLEHVVQEHLEDVATVLLDLVCLSLFCFFMSFQTDWMMIMRSDLRVEHWLLSESVCKQKSHWITTINGKINVWKCKLIFPNDTLYSICWVFLWLSGRALR